MTFLPFPEYRPDVDDLNGQHTQVLSGVVPRGDGYGPVKALQAYTSALPAQCRGFWYARKTDGTIIVFGATGNRIQRLDNSTLTWIPSSKVTALTSISNGSPAVFTLNSHGLENGDALVLSTSASLPTGLTVGTVYYVVNKAANTFNVSLTVGGSAVNTSGAGSGTHSMTYFYTAIESTGQWQSAQFGANVIAVQANVAPQVYNTTTDVAYSNLGGSPPQARYIAVVGRFVVLSGLTSNPTRVQWSDLDGITTWTAGTGFSNYVDLPDGGITRGVAGGEFGLVFQESVIRRMVYVPGAKPAFQFERITEEFGLLGPYSIVRGGNFVFWVSQRGFHQYHPATGIINIGKERVDRTFLADLDQGSLHLLVGAADPASTRVWWAYKSTGNSNTAVFDKIISYDYELKRWSPPLSTNGEYMAGLIKPGLTLESLDTISGSIDALSFSLDSVQSALASNLAAANSSHQLGFFDGSNVEAICETPEQSLDRRVRVRGLRPRTDATTVYGSVRYREHAQAFLSQTTEALIDSKGICRQSVDAKLTRGRIRIPAGTVWTNLMGVEPDFRLTGLR